MARIFISFFNAVEDKNNPNAMPCFYESFIKELAHHGNEFFVFHHRTFNFNTEQAPDYVIKILNEFNPDLVILFNNNFYDVSAIVDCPIIIYEVDSIHYYGNKEVIKNNPSRYKFIVAQEESIPLLQEVFNVDRENILNLPFFTSIKSEILPVQANISFIGSKFSPGKKALWNIFQETNPTDEEKEKFKNFLREVKKNPFLQKELMFINAQVQDVPKIVDSFDLNIAMASISAENRNQILSAISDLGLKVYGSLKWGTETYDDSNLALSYSAEKVYSLADNQRIYNSSKLCININHVQAVSACSWRVCDIMASNGCLVAEDNPGIHKLFPNIAIPIFSNRFEAREQCIKLLKDEKKRKDIISVCQEEIEKKYRFKNILPQIEGFLNLSLSFDNATSVKPIMFNDNIYRREEERRRREEERRRREEERRRREEKRQKIVSSLRYKLIIRAYSILYSGIIFISLLPGFNLFLKNRRKVIIDKYNNLSKIILDKYYNF